MIICCSTSGDGGIGKSGGKCGKSVGISSGWEVKSGFGFAGVRMSVRDRSGRHVRPVSTCHDFL